MTVGRKGVGARPACQGAMQFRARCNSGYRAREAGASVVIGSRMECARAGGTEGDGRYRVNSAPKAGEELEDRQRRERWER